jgi:serine/threonine protein kinase/CheY-like chemotaxis protein
VPLALVIDDEEDIRELVAVLLREADCEVIAASDGLEGIRKLEQSSPDFVVLDVQMPGLDGWETLKGIRALSDVPVLMLTAESTTQDKVRGLVDGADDYLAKPLAPAEFVARIEALLRRSSRPGTPAGTPGQAADDAGFEPGQVIGSYRIEDVLAHGGMSTVYRATHTALERTVALKILSGEFARERITRERFMNEWRIAAALRHPNILPVHDAGEVDGHLFLAMELIDGGDLGHKIIRDGALSPRDAVRILDQMAAALDAAHAAELVHRDFKPGNILLDGDRALLTDFGLSKLLGGNSTRLTAPGRMVGTAQYLSPEQIRGEQVTRRTDVYALGCVIFEALTASSPFDAESDFVLMYAHLERPVPRMSERCPALPVAADDVVATAMEKDQDARFGSAGETLAALKAAFGYE